MNRKTKIEAVDFFCSSGGVTCGFKQAGINVLGGIDIDSNYRETYEINNKATFLNSDISKLQFNEFERAFDIGKNQNNLIFIGCSPCQYYTNLKTNKNKSKETRLLLDDFRRFVEYYLPGFIFIENVPGFNGKNGSPIERFKSFLKTNGYHFIDNVLNTKDYNIPQNRRRYILLATRLDTTLEFPKKSHKPFTVKDAIGDYEIYTPIVNGEIDNSDFMHSASSLTEINFKRIQKTPKDGGDRRSWENDMKIQLDCYKNHKGHYDVYGRMFWDKPSPTITTRFNSFSNGRFGHPEQDRAITLREGATLQTFPLDYVFYSKSTGIIAKMIGNAVPPRFAKLIGNSLIKSFKSDNHDY